MLIQEYPYIDENGKVYNNLIKTYSNEEGKCLLQVETGRIYGSAIDVYPCKYHYVEIDIETEDSDE